jgi:hypothetical protein
MASKKPDDRPPHEYIGHFFKFLATFILIIALALFLFSFTSGT